MVSILAFYRFHPLSEAACAELAAELAALGELQGLRGLIVLATEGVNGTVSGSAAGLELLRSRITAAVAGQLIAWKQSSAGEHPFKRFKVDIRSEIVTLGVATSPIDEGDESHLSPEEWHRIIEAGEDVVLVDTRNVYETAVGKFRGALDPQCSNFQEFPDFLRRSDFRPDQRFFLYCTGGIRCEKAVRFMRDEGFENTFQLHGGILSYLERFPNGLFEGECFVFDHRVAVDSELHPSERYRLCPHCGNPGETSTVCRVCRRSAVICAACLPQPGKATCSKNCAEHYRRRGLTE